MFPPLRVGFPPNALLLLQEDGESHVILSGLEKWGLRKITQTSQKQKKKSQKDGGTRTEDTQDVSLR